MTDRDRKIAEDVRHAARALNSAIRHAAEARVEVELEVRDTSTVGGCRRDFVHPTCRKVL